MQYKQKVNNLDFAKNEKHLSSKLNLTDFKRLEEFLDISGATEPYVHFELTGDNGRYSLPSLNLKVDTSLPMKCQRCFGVVAVPISLNFDYLVTDEASSEMDEIDEVDWLESSNDMDIVALIEDELLIALPIAPMHQEMCHQLNMESGEKANPFSVLKDKFK
jgi:uncharacterized protein